MRFLAPEVDVVQHDSGWGFGSRCVGVGSDCPADDLTGNRVHVWLAWLGDFAADQETLSASLAPDERARAARFVFRRDRDRYILRRGLLRQILGKYAGFTPADIRFDYEGNGKPILVPAAGQPVLHFNVSHSGGLAAYAVTQCCPVGVDIEQVKAIPDWQALVAEHFSKREQKFLFDLPVGQQLAAFYRGWTRKEALLKAMGQGIGQGLRRAEVLVPHNDKGNVHAIDGRADLARRWTVTDLVPFRGYLWAIAAQAETIEVLSGFYRRSDFEIRISDFFPASLTIEIADLRHRFGRITRDQGVRGHVMVYH